MPKPRQPYHHKIKVGSKQTTIGFPVINKWGGIRKRRRKEVGFTEIGR